MDYQIINTTHEDTLEIHKFYDAAIEYQIKNRFPSWPSYDIDLLKQDIDRKEQYKIVVDNQMACFFTINFEDRIIWSGKEDDIAVYLHRIVVNPECKGHKSFGKILHWTIDFAKQRDIDLIRMDTWADNQSLIQYYLSFGFRGVGFRKTPDTEDLPAHQRGNDVILLEYKIY